MSKQQNMIPLQELNLTSRFLFEEVLELSLIHIFFRMEYKAEDSWPIL